MRVRLSKAQLNRVWFCFKQGINSTCLEKLLNAESILNVYRASLFIETSPSSSHLAVKTRPYGDIGAAWVNPADFSFLK